MSDHDEPFASPSSEPEWAPGPPTPPSQRWAAGSPPPPPAEPTGSGRGWLIGGLVVLILAAGGAAAYLLLGDDGPSHPDEWDTRVTAFVAAAEDLRGLRFEHPVHVDFLPEAEFREEVTSEESELTEQDRDELEQATGLLRAVGLVEGDLDLFEAANDLQGEGILGFYSYEDERITMRGAELTVAGEVTLLHELVHVLQDQHFDLGDRIESLEEDPAAQGAFRALVEGDASRIETRYTEDLSAAEQEELADEQTSDLADFEEGVEDVPEVMQTFLAAPYALGEALLALAVTIDGNDEVDRLFDDPPVSDEHLLDPWTLLESDDPITASFPDLGPGEDEFDDGTFGALSWYVMLAERIPLRDALDAADGWGGDTYVAFTRDGVSCMRVNYMGDDPTDLDEMEAALEAWIGALPAGPASLERSSRELTFESCDPGAEVTDIVRGVSSEALTLALSRTYIAIEAVGSGATEEQAECFADAIVHEFDIEQLNDPTFGQDPAVAQRLTELVTTC